jgi:DNA-binding winged helix-turn-helix (wHTH) protein
MSSAALRFDPFVLDPVNRALTRDGVAVELNAKYLDALVLLAAEPGALVSKDRFMAEVWRGVPVTDEALTQCIKTLRRQLGDDAARPRFIETVPKHGYRFIAPVEAGAVAAVEPATSPVPERSLNVFALAAAGTVGSGAAGLLGGLFYGFGGAAQPLLPGTGASAVVLVLLCVTVAIALVGGAGVSLGIALVGRAAGAGSPWAIAGGALGGLVVGAIVKLVGTDAFELLLGGTLGDVTGAGEGALLGGAVGLGSWLARGRRPERATMIAAGCGALAGIAIPLMGGRLFGGSLDLLSRAFPTSRLRFDGFGAVFGEVGLGPISQIVTGALEGALFGGCIVGAMMLARERWGAANKG